MKSLFLSAGTAALLSMAAVAQAAPIDLLALGLEEDTPVRAGSGGVFYSDALGALSNSTGAGLGPLVLDGFTGSEVLFEFDGTGFADFVTVNYEDFGDFEDFAIVASGDNGGSVLELLLERTFGDLSNGTAGLGLNAILRIDSAGFDFSTLEPLAFFADEAFGTGEFTTSVTFSLTALSQIAPIPVPASLPLVLGGLGGFALLARGRRKARHA